MNDVIKFRPAATSAMERASVPSVCECCGREDLKKTVKVTNGETTLWMGTGCAAKACSMGIREFGKALKVEQDAQDSKEQTEREAARRAECDHWFAFLTDAVGPVYSWPGGPIDRFRQIEKLGGPTAARAAYKAKYGIA